MPTITSRHNPIVARYRAAARERGASPAGAPLVLLDGPHLLREALAAALPVREAAFTARATASPDVAALEAAVAGAGGTVHQVTELVMSALSPVATPTGVVALAERRAASLAEALAARPPQLVVVAVGVQEPGNAGAVVRAAEAGGATAVVCAGRGADPLGWKAIRGSMGSALRMMLATEPDPPAVLAAARRAGVRLLAAVPRAGRSLFDTDLRGPVALLLGGEGAGLDPALADGADAAVTIPMQPDVESLNVAVAAALLVYEAWRQRHAPAGGAAGAPGTGDGPGSP